VSVPQLAAASVSATADEAKITNPIDLKATPQEKLRQVQALTVQSRPLVDQVVGAIAKKFGIVAGANEKTGENILLKAARPSILQKKPWHGVEHVRDTLRFKAIPETLADLPAILKTITDHGFELVKSDTDKLLNPGEWGRRIAAFDLRHPTTGQLVEFYAPVPELEAAKKAEGHKIFGAWRGRDIATLTPEELDAREADASHSRWLYTDAWARYLARTGQTERAVLASLTSLAASSSESATKPSESANSSPALSAERGSQPSDGERLNAKNPPLAQTLSQPSKPSETPLEAETTGGTNEARSTAPSSGQAKIDAAIMPADQGIVKSTSPEETPGIRRRRDYRQVQGREVSRTIQLMDGREAKLTRKAHEALSEMDDRIDAVEKLLRCVS
jgi:hypothetical protein